MEGSFKTLWNGKAIKIAIVNSLVNSVWHISLLCDYSRNICVFSYFRFAEQFLVKWLSVKYVKMRIQQWTKITLLSGGGVPSRHTWRHKSASVQTILSENCKELNPSNTFSRRVYVETTSKHFVREENISLVSSPCPSYTLDPFRIISHDVFTSKVHLDCIYLTTVTGGSVDF